MDADIESMITTVYYTNQYQNIMLINSTKKEKKGVTKLYWIYQPLSIRSSKSYIIQ